MPAVADPKSDDDAPDLLRGPALGADGRVERFDRMEPPVPIVSSPRPDAPLELAPVPPPAMQQRLDRYRAELASRDDRRRAAALKFVITLVVLACVAAVAFVVFKPKIDLSKTDGVGESSLLDQLSVGERPPMIISSVPTGAKVIIEGETVGETPWAGDNRWTASKVKIRLQAAGYKPWDGEFDGDRPVTLDVKLKR
jgi:hypothetical protein